MLADFFQPDNFILSHIRFILSHVRPPVSAGARLRNVWHKKFVEKAENEIKQNDRYSAQCRVQWWVVLGNVSPPPPLTPLSQTRD